jgi:ABC-type nickel/cobalt efflux system permease component RcnA
VIRRVVVVAAVAIAWWLGMALPASAHPLGNFSVNVYNGIVVAPDEVRIDHVIDVAEIPTVQAMPTMDANGDEKVTTSELTSFARTRCGQSITSLQLTIGGTAIPLSVQSSDATLVDGQAGLSTTRIECAFSGPFALTDRNDLSFRDDSAAGDVGWREVTLQGDRVTVSDADVPTTSSSAVLTSYPASQQDSPLRTDTASAVVAPGGVALPASDVGSAPTSGTTPWQWGANLLARVSSTASGPIGMSLAVVVALLVGALHALAPGHGKSLVAFALAGRQERAGRAAITVGATVTATHTASVLVLGMLVAGATSVVPVSLFSVISTVTGAMVLILGVVLLRNALRNRGHGIVHHRAHGDGDILGHRHDRPHPHPHSHPHSHSHDPHDAESVGGGTAIAVHEHTQTSDRDDAVLPNARRGVLVTLGITGGLLPSPSALIVLLAAVAAGRAWYGVLLVLSFGIGMALTLAGVGFAVLRGQDRLLAMAERSPKPWMNRVLGRLPVVTASAVVVVGAVLLTRALI